MKVSVVMSFFNRLEDLKVTLRTISKTKHDDVEIIVVDDGSVEPQRCEKLVGYLDLNIKILRMDKKTWTNPCIPFNRGFKQATGDIIIIQNPECLHIGDVISHAVNNVTDVNYLTFSCYSINRAVTQSIHNIMTVDANLGRGCNIDKIKTLVVPYMTSNVVISRFLGWYNHPTVRPYAYHFCSAITKKNLDELGGFDERYASGFGFDDNELITRIKRKGLRVEILSPASGVYVIHQFHSVNPDSRTWKSAGMQRNCRLYHEVTLKETGWKANKK